MSAIEQDLSRFSLEREIFIIMKNIQNLISIQKGEPRSSDKRTLQEKINEEELTLGELQFRLNETPDVASLIDPLIAQIKDIQKRIITFRGFSPRDDTAAREKASLIRQEIDISQSLFEQKESLIGLENQQISTVPSSGTVPQDNTLRNLLLLGGLVLII